MRADARAAVVGGGIGGMTAAGVLARAGLEVTLFERDTVLGGKAQRFLGNGYALDTGPTLLTMPSTVRETFDALGALDLMPELTALPAACEYLYRDGPRLVAHRELEAFAEEARQFGPREADGARRFYAEAEAIYQAAGVPFLSAPFEGLGGFMTRVARQRGLRGVLAGMKLGTLARLAERCFRSEPLRQFVNRFATYVGASPYGASAAYALIAHLERAEGVHHPQGGMGMLSARLETAMRRLGVRVRTGVRARLLEDGTRPRVGPEGDEAPFDLVVVNADPVGLGRAKARDLSLSGYVALFELDGAAKLPHHSVLFAADYRGEFDALLAGDVPEDPTLYVCCPSTTDTTMATPDRRGLYVMVNAPTCALGDDLGGERALDQAERFWSVAGPKLEETMGTRVREAFPSVGTRLELVGRRTPVDFMRQGAPGGALYGCGAQGRLGPFARPRMRGGSPGVFFAGGGTHPGGGVPMVMLSGRFAASLALEQLGAGAPS